MDTEPWIGDVRGDEAAARMIAVAVLFSELVVWTKKL